MAKRTPPRPRSTANLPPGLASYWAKRGVPSSAAKGSTKKATTKKTATKKVSSKRRSTKRKSRSKKK